MEGISTRYELQIHMSWIYPYRTISQTNLIKFSPQQKVTWLEPLEPEIHLLQNNIHPSKPSFFWGGGGGSDVHVFQVV